MVLCIVGEDIDHGCVFRSYFGKEVIVPAMDVLGTYMLYST